MRQAPVVSTTFDALSDGGERRRLAVEVWPPEPDPHSAHGDQRCLLRLQGLADDRYVHGIDGLQALSLALKVLENEFRQRADAGWTFHLPGCPDSPIDVCASYFLAPAPPAPLTDTRRADGLRISSNVEEMDLALIHSELSRTYWAKGIPVDTLRRALRSSLCFGLFDARGAQIGFARVITDAATFAYLADVFIVDAQRGKGLSKWLLETVVAHPELQGLRRFALATRDAQGLYRRFGFKPLAHPETFMEVWDPDVYLRR